MTTGPGAVPRLGDPVAHQSATREVLRVLWAEYLCGNLADGGELGVRQRLFIIVFRLPANETEAP